MAVDFKSEVVYAGSFDAPLGIAFTGAMASVKERESFCEAHRDELDPLAIEVLEDYDDRYFQQYCLVAVVLDAGSGSTQFEVKQVLLRDGTLHVQIGQIPMAEDVVGTADMARNIVIVEIGRHFADLPVTAEL